MSAPARYIATFGDGSQARSDKTKRPVAFAMRATYRASEPSTATASAPRRRS